MNIFTASFDYTDYRMESIYRLRYKVYCEERGFENPEDHPGRIEKDDYDKYSVHFAAIRNSKIVGTARVILNNENGFPLEKHATIDSGLLTRLNRNSIGEISRLAFAREFRRPISHRLTADYRSFASSREAVRADSLLLPEHDLTLKLYHLILMECRRHNLAYVIAIMAESLLRLLKRHGIIFVPIGPPVQYHGTRIPCICSIDKMVRSIKYIYSPHYTHLNNTP